MCIFFTLETFAFSCSVTKAFVSTERKRESDEETAVYNCYYVNTVKAGTCVLDYPTLNVTVIRYVFDLASFIASTFGFKKKTDKH